MNLINIVDVKWSITVLPPIITAVVLFLNLNLNIHFLLPGIAYTTGLSHNPFTWLLLLYGKVWFVCLCITSHWQRGHLETAPPFTVPCEGREAR